MYRSDLYTAEMSQGFLGFDSSLMLDVVVCALVLVVPVIIYSLYLVKVRRNYTLHAAIQTTLAVVLLIVVVAFEVDMRLHGGWQNIVNKSPEAPRVTGEALSQVRTMLWVHLVFAVSTPLLWATSLVLAWRRFANPPQPGLHSRTHKTLGWLATLDLVLTSVTGLGSCASRDVGRILTNSATDLRGSSITPEPPSPASWGYWSLAASTDPDRRVSRTLRALGV
jgi:putative membrane protein